MVVACFGKGKDLVLGVLGEGAKVHTTIGMFFEGVVDGGYSVVEGPSTLRCDAMSEWGEGGKG